MKQNSFSRTVVLAGILGILIGLGPPAFAQAQEKAAVPAKPSLYDRLGGLYPISPVVDDFIDRVYVNPP